MDMEEVGRPSMDSDDEEDTPPALQPRRSQRLQHLKAAARKHSVALTQEEREILDEYQDDIEYNAWVDSQIAKSQVTYDTDRTLLVAKSILQINDKVAQHMWSKLRTTVHANTWTQEVGRQRC